MADHYRALDASAHQEREAEWLAAGGAMDWYDEHERDPLDNADGFVILDGIPVRLDCCAACLTMPCACLEEDPRRSAR